MRPTPVMLLAALSAATVPAQIGTVPDVGLTMTGGLLPVTSGLACGPFACVAHPAPAIPRGQARNITHFGAPQSLYAIGVGLPPFACIPWSGIANYLMLGNPVITMSVGVTGPRLLSTPCAQGTAAIVLLVPAAAPPGLLFNIQSLGISPASGQVAFSHAIGTAVGI